MVEIITMYPATSNANAGSLQAPAVGSNSAAQPPWLLATAAAVLPGLVGAEGPAPAAEEGAAWWLPAPAWWVLGPAGAAPGLVGAEGPAAAGVPAQN